MDSLESGLELEVLTPATDVTADFKALTVKGDLVTTEGPRFTPYIFATLDQVKQVLQHEPLMFDTEADALYSGVDLAQFYQESWPCVILVRHPDLNELTDLLDSRLVIMQNASYDVSTIQGCLSNRWAPKDFDDVLLLGRLHYYTELKFSLDNLMFITLGYDPYLGQGLVKKEMQKLKWSGDLTKNQCLYAATDVYELPKVWNAVKHMVNDDNYKLDKQTLIHCFNMQNNGMPVDPGKRMALQMRTEMEVEEINCPINVNSWKQVRPYIGEEESDGLALARFEVEGNERAAEVRKARGLLKMISFLKKFDTPNNIIYGKFAPTARSGRLTCKAQNLQQLPRSTKGVFGYHKDEGEVLVYADFSQLELRCACAIIGDRKMIEFLLSGKDLHQLTSDILFGPGKGKDERTLAKTANFNLLYGGSANMLGKILLKTYLMLLPDKELYSIKSKWLALYPDIAAWQDAGIEAWDNGQAWATPLGRRYLGKLMTDQLNIKIQGSGADVAKLAFHRIMSKLPSVGNELMLELATIADDKLPVVLNDNGIKMRNFIHDSFIVSCKDDPREYKAVADIVGESMKSAWEDMSQYFKIKDLPNPVQVLVGYNWGDIENDDLPNIYEANF